MSADILQQEHLNIIHRAGKLAEKGGGDVIGVLYTQGISVNANLSEFWN